MLSREWFCRDSILRWDRHFSYYGSLAYSYYKPNIDFKSGKLLKKKIREGKNAENEFKLLFPESETIISISTDGSKIIKKNGTYVGFAIWCEKEECNLTGQINNNASIFTAECIAILMAIKKMSELRIKGAIIFSDSESALKGLSQVNKGINLLKSDKNWLMRQRKI